MIVNDYSTKNIIIKSSIIFIIIIGLIIKANYNNIYVFSISKYISLLELIVSFVFVFLITKNSDKNNNVFVKILVYSIFYIISFISISSIINRSIIYFGEKKMNKEYVHIKRKKIIDNHGVGYFLIINNLSNKKNVRLIVAKKDYEKLKKNDTILVEYFTIKNILKYFNKYESIISDG